MKFLSKLKELEKKVDQLEHILKELEEEHESINDVELNYVQLNDVAQLAAEGSGGGNWHKDATGHTYTGFDEEDLRGTARKGEN